jgi:hypothetical protein
MDKYVKYADQPDDSYALEKDVNQDYGLGIDTLITMNSRGIIDL